MRLLGVGPWCACSEPSYDRARAKVVSAFKRSLRHEGFIADLEIRPLRPNFAEYCLCLYAGGHSQEVRTVGRERSLTCALPTHHRLISDAQVGLDIRSNRSCYKVPRKGL
ncbi:hypothetical protein AB6A40_006195 [Gnathostoma spinigerum]|uniref:Reverse transcriptase n=1 Tax=Gnathostoma spinigerum TaxID=75299 RepID=A0ABD6EJR7_9BILA